MRIRERGGIYRYIPKTRSHQKCGYFRGHGWIRSEISSGTCFTDFWKTWKNTVWEKCKNTALLPIIPKTVKNTAFLPISCKNAAFVTDFLESWKNAVFLSISDYIPIIYRFIPFLGGASPPPDPPWLREDRERWKSSGWTWEFSWYNVGV